MVEPFYHVPQRKRFWDAEMTTWRHSYSLLSLVIQIAYNLNLSRPIHICIIIRLNNTLYVPKWPHFIPVCSPFSQKSYNPIHVLIHVPEATHRHTYIPHAHTCTYTNMQVYQILWYFHPCIVIVHCLSTHLLSNETLFRRHSEQGQLCFDYDKALQVNTLQHAFN